MGHQRIARLLFLHSLDVPEFIEPENCLPDSPDLNPIFLLVESFAAKIVSLKDQRH